MSAPVITKKPVLIASWLCPFVQRAWTALNHKGVEFDLAFINLFDKPAWLPSVSPLGKVPVLTWKDEADTTQTVHESLVLLDFIDEQYKGSPLLPASPVERAHARISINRIDQKFVAAFNRLLFSLKEDKDAEAAQATGKELGAELDWLQSELTAHGGPYLTGPNLTNVDAAVAPWILRAHVLEHIRGYKLFEGYPQVAMYAKTLRDTPAIAGTLRGPDDMAKDSTWEQEILKTMQTRTKQHLFF